MCSATWLAKVVKKLPKAQVLGLKFPLRIWQTLAKHSVLPLSASYAGQDAARVAGILPRV